MLTEHRRCSASPSVWLSVLLFVQNPAVLTSVLTTLFVTTLNGANVHSAHGRTNPTLFRQLLTKTSTSPRWNFLRAGVVTVLRTTLTTRNTWIRQKQVDEIRAKLESEGADRFAVQNALMPYLQLLPEDLRGKNERIDEPLS